MPSVLAVEITVQSSSLSSQTDRAGDGLAKQLGQNCCLLRVYSKLFAPALPSPKSKSKSKSRGLFRIFSIQNI